MSPLHPTLNPVQVLVFTPSGWIRGTFHVPAVKGMLTFLNTQEEILKLTEVSLPGSKHILPFLALQRNASFLVVPQGGMDAMKPEIISVPRERRLVSCLFSLGSIRGRLDVPETLRTSDFLLRKPGFIELNQCHIGPNPYLDPKDTTGEAIPLVYVNSHALVGTTEESGMGL